MRELQNQLKIFIAEDECLFAALLEAWVEDCGLEPLGPAYAVQSAIDLLKNCTQPDAAILDIDLRGETIYPIAEILRFKQVPFLFITGCACAPPAPFDQVPILSKPTTKQQFLPLLHQIIQERLANS